MAEELLQGLMDKGLFEVCGTRKGEQDVCMHLADKSLSKPKPLVIHFTRDAAVQKPRGFQPIPVKKLVPFPYKVWVCLGSYKSDKVIPGRYVPWSK